MATRKAPGARGRGRWVALTTVFFATLIASSAVFSPAFGADKGPDDPGNGNGKSAPVEVSAPAGPKNGGSGNGSQGQGNGGQGSQSHGDANQGSQGSGQGGSNGKGDQGTPAPSGNEGSSQGGQGAGSSGNTDNDTTGNGISGQQIEQGSAQGPVDKDGEPNKPPTEKYNGPCTRHKDPFGNGTGHDWHRGWGKGHNGIQTEPEEPGDNGDEPTDEGTPPGDNGSEDENPYLPFTPPLQPASNVKPAGQKDPDIPDYLPYTGGEFDALLAVAACAAMMGTGLRSLSRRRLYSHRRIAR